MTQPNFWESTHPLSGESERLCAALVPNHGPCASLQGELLRASMKIHYDWFNNGWGCNNWSGAVIFLREHIGALAQTTEETPMAAFHEALREVHQYSHGEPVNISDDHAAQLVTTIHETVVRKVLANPEPVAFDGDMWQFQEPDYREPRDRDAWGWDDVDDLDSTF